MRYVAERVFVGRGRFGGLQEPHLKLFALQDDEAAGSGLVDAIRIEFAGQTHTSGSAWLRHETPHSAFSAPAIHRFAPLLYSCVRTSGMAGVSNALPGSYTHLRAHETDSYLVCRLL